MKLTTSDIETLKPASLKSKLENAKGSKNTYNSQ